MYLISITGGTASGKTTFVELLKSKNSTSDITYLSQDDYYKQIDESSSIKKEATNFDHPSAIDFELLLTHITALKKGIPINKPNYCFKTHNRLPTITKVHPKKILILEGILILTHQQIINKTDFSIFIDAPNETRLARRIARDINERGRTKESIQQQYKTTIKPMHNQFIEPCKMITDLVIDGSRNFTDEIEKVTTLISEQLSK